MVKLQVWNGAYSGRKITSIYVSYFRNLAKTCPLCGLPILSIERLIIL